MDLFIDVFVFFSNINLFDINERRQSVYLHHRGIVPGRNIFQMLVLMIDNKNS